MAELDNYGFSENIEISLRQYHSNTRRVWLSGQLHFADQWRQGFHETATPNENARKVERHQQQAESDQSNNGQMADTRTRL